MRRIFLALAGITTVFFLNGCCRPRVCEKPYWRVVTTDVEGCWIAEWISEDPVKKSGDGYCFWAVQRRIFKPFTLTFKYPLGRFVKVEAPNIIITPTTIPCWLWELERGSMPFPDQCKRVRLKCGYVK